MYHTVPLSHFLPSDLLAVADYFADYAGSCLLYSGGELDSAQRSFLSLFPYEKIRVQGKAICWQQGFIVQQLECSNPWQGLQDIFFDCRGEQAEAYAFGFLGYEMGGFADLDRPLPYRRAACTDDAYWQRCALVLVYEHATCSASVILAPFAMDWISTRERKWMEKLSTPEGWQDVIEKHKNQPIKQFLDGSLSIQPYPQRKADYLDRVAQAQEWIRAGDIYQVNLSQLFVLEGQRRPFDVFVQMCRANPAPFSAYLNASDYAIVCTSPERFLQKKGTALETRPIKGTMARGKTLEEDHHLKQQLLGSVKERAELLMITDLMRNDLGRISQVGSVETLDIWRCEAYTNVFHLLSIIRSQLKENLNSLAVIQACFPGGSITGCPKLRAMEIIHTLEGEARGIYTGSMGYMTGSGDFDLNIAIRTLIFKASRIHLQLGAGIVIDSNPEQEYQETLLKGDSLFKILQLFPQFDNLEERVS